MRNKRERGVIDKILQNDIIFQVYPNKNMNEYIFLKAQLETWDSEKKTFHLIL